MTSERSRLSNVAFGLGACPSKLVSCGDKAGLLMLGGVKSSWVEPPGNLAVAFSKCLRCIVLRHSIACTLGRQLVVAAPMSYQDRPPKQPRTPLQCQHSESTVCNSLERQLVAERLFCFASVRHCVSTRPFRARHGSKADSTHRQDYAGELPRIPPDRAGRGPEDLSRGPRLSPRAGGRRAAGRRSGRDCVRRKRPAVRRRNAGVFRKQRREASAAFACSTIATAMAASTRARSSPMSFPGRRPSFIGRGGVLVADAPDILYFQDTNGDGQADEEREVLYTGLGVSNVQGLINSFQWGLDNRIYSSLSSSGAELTKPDDKEARPLAIRGRDIAIDPAHVERDTRQRRRPARHVVRRLGQSLRLLQQRSPAAGDVRGSLPGPQSVPGRARRRGGALPPMARRPMSFAPAPSSRGALCARGCGSTAWSRASSKAAAGRRAILPARPGRRSIAAMPGPRSGTAWRSLATWAATSSIASG